MCIAIYKPAGEVISKETLEICAQANGDGCGFSYINTSHTGNKKIVVKKTLDFETFYRQYERATTIEPDSPFLIHFRIKTHGPVSKVNCHPFKIDNDHVFIHNGVISGVGTDKEKSDTRLFNEKVLQTLDEGWMDSQGVKTLVEDFINHSKLVVMNIDGDIQIYNEAKGNWNEGCWYSNTSYKKPTYQGNYHQGRANGYSRFPRPANAIWKQCDKCNVSCGPANSSYYCDMQEFKVFCSSCARHLKGRYLIFESDEITKEMYESWADKEPTATQTAAFQLN